MLSEKPVHDVLIHGAKWVDNFWPDAAVLRNELLEYRDWKFMSILSEGEQYINHTLARINGLTTGLLSDKAVQPLPHVGTCIEFMKENSEDFSQLMLGTRHSFDIQCSGRIYGRGGWLSEHTDLIAGRVIAWILYLTNPDQGEWTDDMGGALQLFIPGTKEKATIRPCFNRLAMFNVTPESWHQVDKIRFGTSWTDGRLALSGWFVSRQHKAGIKITYKKNRDTTAENQIIEDSLRGEEASIALQEDYQRFNNVSTVNIQNLKRLLVRKWDAHRNSPPGYHLAKLVESDIDAVEYVD